MTGTGTGIGKWNGDSVDVETFFFFVNFFLFHVFCFFPILIY